jgi:uncharacterized membrane protein
MKTGAVRQAYLDRVRGLAVLVMIEAHVLDGWTRMADRQRPAFGYAMVLGGFAAPLFLFLAGLSLVLSAESKYRRTGDRQASWKAVQVRGWQIFGLAFLFRLQSYILTAGYSNLVGLLKVDILNIMGPALALAGLIGGRAKARSGRALLFAAFAAAIAMLTPIVRTTPLLNWIPDPIQWYFRPSPNRTNFTLFPWAGFVFAGAVVGVVIDGVRQADRAFRVQMALAAASILIAVGGYEASFLPSIYTRSEFWTSSPTFFLLRVGVITLLLPLAFLWERSPWRGLVSQWSPIEELGRASLFVYWIHVEMVYGFLGWPLRRNLSFEGAILAYVLFSAFILALVLLKNHLVTIRKADAVRASSPAQASI